MRDQAGTLALLDVDHFKRFNDVYGHRAGDEVLRIVAKILHARLHPHGLVARFGGEEFAVILDGCPIDKAKELIESARIAIGPRDIQFQDKRLRVAASAGVAELIPGGESMEDWLQRADDAMYRSKELGRNCGHWMDGNVPIRIESPRPSAPFARVASAEVDGEGIPNRSHSLPRAMTRRGEAPVGDVHRLPPTPPENAARAIRSHCIGLSSRPRDVGRRIRRSSRPNWLERLDLRDGHCLRPRERAAAMRSLLPIVRATCARGSSRMR